MELTYPIHQISQYNEDNNHPTFHPLVTVINFSKANRRDWGAATTVRFKYDMYCIFLKDVKCGDIRYGRQYYDYQAGTLVFFKPGQVASFENMGSYQPLGFGLIFHPDLMLGKTLAKVIDGYNFFSYQTHEALHISEQERQIVLDCFAKIDYELQRAVDKHSRKLITANIELFLSYCQRFYDRQFMTRQQVNSGVLVKFEALLDDYFQSDRPQQIGLPSVAHFASELHLSANYFGDLIKKETGQSAKEYIQNKTINVAKEKVISTNKTINEIAAELGFKYAQHFTRIFKQKVGVSPSQYRNLP